MGREKEKRKKTQILEKRNPFQLCIAVSPSPSRSKHREKAKESLTFAHLPHRSRNARPSILRLDSVAGARTCCRRPSTKPPPPRFRVRVQRT